MNTDTPKTDCIVRKCNQVDAEMAFAIVTDHADCLERKLTTVTEQRDRLAEALLELRNKESFFLGGAVNEIVEQALQSLTPKP